MSTFCRGAASVEPPRRSPESRQSSHHAGFDVLAHALRVVVVVVVVVVGAASRGVEGRDAVKVEHEVLPVAHGGMALIARNAHCGGGTGAKITRSAHMSLFKDFSIIYSFFLQEQMLI